MEKSADKTSVPGLDYLSGISSQLDTEKKIVSSIMSIRLTDDGLVIRDEPADKDSEELYRDVLPGVYCQGVQYFDLSGVYFINHMGMAILIEILKSLLSIGVEVQFVNVDERIKNKIRDIGLESIIHCEM